MRNAKVENIKVGRWVETMLGFKEIKSKEIIGNKVTFTYDCGKKFHCVKGDVTQTYSYKELYG